MKTLFICWGLAATIVLLWPRVSSFQQRCLLTVQPPVRMELLARPSPSVCAPSGRCRVAERWLFWRFAPLTRSSVSWLEEYYKALGKEIPLGRAGEAEEFANLACLLASEQGSYITGTAINVDGGRSPVV